MMEDKKKKTLKEVDSSCEIDQTRLHKIYSSYLGVKGNTKITIKMIDYGDELGVRAIVIKEELDKNGGIISTKKKSYYYPSDGVAAGIANNKRYYYITGRGLLLWQDGQH